MLIYDKRLKYSGKIIKSADTSILLDVGKEAHYFGVLDFNGKYTKVIPFVKTQHQYKARLIINKEDLDFLDKSTFYIEAVDQANTKRSNSVKLKFNVDEIKLNVKKESASECLRCMKEMRQINENMLNVIQGNVLTQINIANSRTIKPGMIPVAIDNKGNFVATYPFADIIREINGVKAHDESVVITPKNIPYGSTTLEAYLENTKKAVKGLKDYNDSLGEQLKELNKKLSDLIIAFETHIDNDIL